ncbi:MAG TPA: hypothetical protein DGT21_08085 [Armatimonadetes bacterium]|nr:hypothetical protein [Armatimonadota bacterium]
MAESSGDGLPDILGTLTGLGKRPAPETLMYRSRGGGGFEPVRVQQGVPTHEAKVADLTSNDLPDTIGQTEWPDRHSDG